MTRNLLRRSWSECQRVGGVIRRLTGVSGARDKALLLVGFAGAFRRSELVALEVSDLRFMRKGVLIHVRHSKTDQEGEGRTVCHSLCQARCVQCERYSAG